MRVIKFRYDKFSAWHIFAFILIVIAIQAILLLNSDSIPTFGEIVFLLATLVLTVYFIKKYFIPTVKGKSALIISEEKIFINNTDQIIYWKDILEIDIMYKPFRKAYYIGFKLKDNKSIEFYPVFFEAEIDKIHNILQDYLREVLLKRDEIHNQ